MPTIQPSFLSVFCSSFGGAAGFLCALSFKTGFRAGTVRLSLFFD
jgi:hypothetical protein